MKKKQIIIIIITLIVLLMLCGGILILLGKLKNNENNIDTSQDAPELEVETELQRVASKNVLLTAEKIINDNLESSQKFYIEDAYYQEIEVDVEAKIYIYGRLFYNNYANNKTMYIILNTNYDNMLYDEKIEKDGITKTEYDSIIAKLKEQTTTTKLSSYDSSKKFTLKNATDEDIITRYLEYYQNMVLYDTKDAYDLLNDDYKNKRFGSYNSFEKYVNDYNQTIENLTLEKYGMSYGETTTKYIAQDTKENYYIFECKSVLDFDIQLDNYTIEIDDYKAKYNALTDQQKAAICLSNVIQMINTKDYENLYKKVDETFRSKNFPTIDEFKNYINNRYYYYNIVSNTQARMDSNIYVLSFDISSGNNTSAETKKANLLIQLVNDTEFKISFVNN